ncbi:type IVB secretion system protein IcmH/DotU [Pseudomonas sp. NA-150]|uniref:type IVB secretion system protein IcmH/DotU n=1 Tax=Pseudomonas sp. NA-150 TaxID=3367525 RepID=UPI0037C577B9
MTEEINIDQDVTKVLGLEGEGPGGRPLTNAPSRSSIGLMEDEMLSAAKSPPAETFSSSINPLIRAASELVSFVVQTKDTGKLGDLVTTHNELLEHLKIFEERALFQGVDGSLLEEASYVLCTVVDDVVVHAESDAVEKKGWLQMSLLGERHKETFGGEKFFQILDRRSTDPVKYLHLLELMYLCLALGFEGKYRLQERSHTRLGEIRDGLYRIIRHLRGDVPRELSPHWHGLKDQRRNLVRMVPWWLVLLFTFVCLAVMYSGFAWVLSEQRESILEPYRQLDSALIQTPSDERDA